MAELNLKLSPPQSKYFMSEAKYTALVCGFGCLRGSTKVVTANGGTTIAIKDIKPNQNLMTYNCTSGRFEHHATPSGAFIKGTTRLLEITTNFGSFACSPDHRVLTDLNDYVYAKELKITDRLKSRQNVPCYVRDIGLCSDEEPYYDISVDGNHNYVTEDGTIHHNSGKTFVGTTRMLSSIIQYPTMNFLYCAPTLSLVRDIFYPLISEMLIEMELKYTINRSENIVFVEDHGQIFCRSMERPELLVGFSIGDALLDEWDLVTIERGTTVLNKVTARMRQRFPDGKKNQLYVTTTPEGFKQTYINFKKEPLEDSLLLKASTHSNQENLPDDYIPSLKAQYPKQLIEAYLNGEFVNLTSGSVYYSFDRATCDCTSVYREGETLHVGIDFNVLDCSCTIGVFRDSKKELHIIDGLYHLNDTNEIVEVLRNKYPRSPIYVYPDSSGKSTSSKAANQSDFTILKKAGFHIRAKSKNPLIKERVMSVNGALDHNRVRINVSKCKDLTESLEQQVYNINTGQPEKLVNSSLDDINDSFGYMVYFIYPIQKMRSGSTTISGF